jgi:hypothetical protein
MFKSLFSEIQKVYEGSKGNLERNLAKFNDSLLDANLLIGIGLNLRCWNLNARYERCNEDHT